MAIDQRPLGELEADLGGIRAAPAEAGIVELIVRRPAPGERELLATARIDLDEGLVGDRWSRGKRDPEDQVMIVGARAAAIFSGSDDQADWALAGDQLYVDLDLSYANLPAETRLAIGESAVLEVSEEPHLGCGKFIRRFGVDAMKFVNSPQGRELRLRGLGTRVLAGGEIRPGDRVAKL
jgi:hypothetical protein